MVALFHTEDVRFINVPKVCVSVVLRTLYHNECVCIFTVWWNTLELKGIVSFIVFKYSLVRTIEHLIEYFQWPQDMYIIPLQSLYNLNI